MSPWVATATPDAVSVGTNDWLQAVTLASKVVTQLKGSGTILEVHGIPGVQEDDDAFAGFKSVLAQCPDITIAGQVTGDYNPAATQQAVLQFLSSHPGKVDGVFEAGTMTAGIIQAFKQLGRPVPVIADLGSTEGSMAYAGRTKGVTRSTAASTPDDAIGQTFAKVVLAMLDGHGPALDQLVTTINIIDNGNLRSVYRSSWTLTPPTLSCRTTRTSPASSSPPSWAARDDGAVARDERRGPGGAPAARRGHRRRQVLRCHARPRPGGPGPASRRSPYDHRREWQRQEHAGEDPRRGASR